MKKLKCQNCQYSWEYNGKHQWWATCPRCLRKVKVENKGENGNQEN